jgi:ElaB/YqjD/DUF883 family membrane-anchored ribosome-binding protein
MSDLNQPTDLSIAVSVGRIEEMIKSLFEQNKEQSVSMRDLDMRVRDLEQAIQRIEAKQVPKQPWYAIVGGVVGIITGVGSLIALLTILSNINTP